MTDSLHLPARPGAPVACDMSGAPDTLDERRAEYRSLFGRSLSGVAFMLSADARDQVEDLARREAQCCPFLDYRVETVGDEVRFSITGAGLPALLEMLDLPRSADAPGVRP